MKALRPLELDDLPLLRQFRNNIQLRNGTQGFRYPVSETMEESWYNQNAVNGAPGRAVYAIQDETGRFVGLAQLMEIDNIHRNAALGIFIGAEKERGKGHAKKALLELLEFGFDSLNLLKIFLYVNSDNAPAIALYEKTGFAKEGLLKKHYFQDGQFVDVLVYAKFNDR